MIIWTLACAVLFGIARLSRPIHASAIDVGVRFIQGSVCAILAFLFVSAILLRKRVLLGVFVAVAILGTTSWGLNQWQGAPPRWNGGVLFHPGGSFVSLFIIESALLAASALVLRINGYRLARHLGDDKPRTLNETP